jgi:hypothetical protein
VDLFLCKIDQKPDHNWEKNGTENQDDRHTQILWILFIYEGVIQDGRLSYTFGIHKSISFLHKP